MVWLLISATRDEFSGTVSNFQHVNIIQSIKHMTKMTPMIRNANFITTYLSLCWVEASLVKLLSVETEPSMIIIKPIIPFKDKNLCDSLSYLFLEKYWISYWSLRFLLSVKLTNNWQMNVKYSGKCFCYMGNFILDYF